MPPLFGVFPGDAKTPKTESDGKNINMESQKFPYQLIIITVISFVIYLVCTSLGVYTSYKSNITFANDTSAKSLRGTFTALLGLGVLLPVLYFMYFYTKTSNNKGEDIKNSKKSLIAIAFVSYTLMILAASLGIWLSNCRVPVPGTINKPDAIEVTFIVILVLAILLPIFYAIFYFRDKICAQFAKT